MTEEKKEGVMFKVGGEEFLLTPLTLRQMKSIIPLIREIQNSGDVDPLGLIDKVTALFHAVLSINTPDLTLDRVQELVTFPDALRLMGTIVEVSGFRKIVN
jgi:hypothetical protein